MNSSILDNSQTFSNRDIITIGCEDQLQRRNALKGLAMQKLVHLAMKESKEDISIKRIFEKLLEKQTDYYLIEKPFKTQSKYFLHKWAFFHRDEFNNYDEIWFREEYASKEWKVCNNCGLRIKAAQQFSRKCRKCNKGWFHYVTDKKLKWNLETKGQKEFILDYLLEKDYIKQVQLRKRLDFFHYSKGIFSIYEAKNKEISGLNSMDLRKTLIYPFIVQRSGYPVNELVIVFNGKIKEELLRKIRQGYGQNFSFKIKLWPVKQFLLANNIQVKGIVIKQTNSGYSYDILHGNSAKIVIDLRQLDSSY